MSDQTTQSPLVSQLENMEKYYERMHKDARAAIEIAGRMSLEMKERLIEVRRKLKRARWESANPKILN